MFPTYMSGKNGFGAILVVFGAILVGFEVILGVLGRFWRIRKKRPGEWVSFCEEIIRFDSLFSLVLQVVVYIVFHAVKALLLHIRAAPALERIYLFHTIL